MRRLKWRIFHSQRLCSDRKNKWISHAKGNETLCLMSKQSSQRYRLSSITAFLQNGFRYKLDYYADRILDCWLLYTLTTNATKNKSSLKTRNKLHFCCSRALFTDNIFLYMWIVFVADIKDLLNPTSSNILRILQN